MLVFFIFFELPITKNQSIKKIKISALQGCKYYMATLVLIVWWGKKVAIIIGWALFNLGMHLFTYVCK